MVPPSPSGPDRVPVPARLAAARRARGLVVPFITLSHRDPARPVWGMLDPARAHHVLWGKCCQICGQPLTDRVVVFIRSSDYLRGLSIEPGLHPECAHYSRRACPMLAGQQHHYHPNPALRLAHCGDPTCRCRAWRDRDPDSRERPNDGRPVEAWYEAWIGIADYQVIADPGSQSSDPAVGIKLTGVRFLRLRKVRHSAAPDTGNPAFEALDALITAKALFGF